MKRFAKGLVLAVWSMSLHAQTTNPEYHPFESSMLSGSPIFTTQGYQELKLPNERWYVAYQGDKNTSPNWIEIAWASRSAQLCAASGAKAFVELRYPFEAILEGEKQIARDRPEPEVSGFLPVVTYVPIFTPAPAAPVVAPLGPSKLGAVRCLTDWSGLRDPARAVFVQDVFEKARQAGINLAPQNP